jgi:prophage regulatory protein
MKKNPEERLLRLSKVLTILPIGRSTWWAGVKSGKFPQPIKLGERTTAWKESDIQQIVNNGVASPATEWD